MTSRFQHPYRRVRAASLALCAAALLAACGGSSDGARPGITRIEITSKETAFDGASFGAAGAYELLRGKAYGTMDPSHPAHAELALLAKTPRNADGLIEYSMDIGIMRPVDAAKGSGKILYDVVNRGNPTIFGQLNKGSLTAPGNGFLMRQGYSVVWSGWQPEVNPVTGTYKLQVPLAMEGNQPVVGRVMEVYVPDTPQTAAAATHALQGNVLTSTITYPPVSRDVAAAKVSLTVRQNYDDARVTLSPSAVTFVSDTQVRLDLGEASGKGFDVGAIYELIYDAKNAYVGGMGFVAVRDLLSFLRNQTKDRAGVENPVRPAGMPIKAAYGWGLSQSGRFLKDMVYQGFHVDLDNRLVFDGVHPVVAGSRMTDHNRAFAMTSRWIRQHEERNYPGAEFPFAYPVLSDPLTGKTDGVLNRCLKANNCPKIFHQDSDLEFWHGRSSLVVTDPRGNPIEQPANVRVFMNDGQQHGPGNGTPTNLPNCKYMSDPLDGSPFWRALVVAMDQWVTQGVEPPPSRFPNLREGTLQTFAEAAIAWPTLTGLTFNPRHAPAQLGNYDTVPPSYSGSYPVLIPKWDAAGNPVGGISGADLAAPLGNYMGRNFRRAGHAEDELCAGSGGYIPFAKTLAERMAAGDIRPSLEERYPGGAAAFTAARRARVEALIRDRLVLAEERDSYTNQVPFPQ